MEVVSKELHKHAALVAILIVGLLLISGVIMYLGVGRTSKALITQMTFIKPGSNGLAHISFDKPQVNDELLNDSQIGQAGQSARQTIILETTAETIR